MDLNLNGKLHGKTFVYPVRVYFSDTDAGGVVYHARYLDFAEHARSELLRYLGGSQYEMMNTASSAFVIRSVHADYLQPARLDDLLTVRTVVTKCSRVILEFEQRILRAEDDLAVLKVRAGFISVTAGRPLPMPEAWRAAIQPLIS